MRRLVVAVVTASFTAGAGFLVGHVTAEQPAPRVIVRPSTPDLPTTPCATEDSAGPCYWDAGVMGNGHGRSFWVDDKGAVFYLAPDHPTSTTTTSTTTREDLNR